MCIRDRFYSCARDNLGNIEAPPLANDTWIQVTGQPPLTNLSIGEPSSDEGLENWVTSHTPLTFTAHDPDGHPNFIVTKYRIYNVHNTTWYPSWITFMESFTLMGSGTHYIEYYSLDNNGTGNYSTEMVHNQTFQVDDTSPGGMLRWDLLSGVLVKDGM